MYSEHLKNKKNMHVGDILGFILGVIRVKNQLKTKYFNGPFLKNDCSCSLAKVTFWFTLGRKKLLKEQNRAKYGHFPHFPSILGYIANFTPFPFSESIFLALDGLKCI